MIKLHIIFLELLVLHVSAWIHFVYCVYIISKGVISGLSHAHFKKPSLNKAVVKEGVESTTFLHQLSPIVFVHGIFGFGQGKMGGVQYFGGAENKDERVLVPDLGSLTSIYDRARELFYYLKGGLVDYGEDHSKACGHSQFGKYYEQGHYPEWDEDHPIQLVGHSSGAQVARLLQQMLANKSFKGYDNTGPNWVLSITSLSGALNGSTRTYIDGIELGHRRSVKPISLLQMCRFAVIIYEWLDIPWMKSLYSFGFDHFNISGTNLLGKCEPFVSGDWILPDLTLEGSTQLNYQLQTFPCTYYFSYATKCTRNIFGVTLPSTIFSIHPLLFLSVLQMTQWRLPSDAPPPYKGYRDEDWWDNDGALNTLSMLYPRSPIQHPHRLVLNDSDSHPMQPGIWYYKIIEGDHLLFIMNRERARVQFDLVYNEIIERCRKHFSNRPKSS